MVTFELSMQFVHGLGIIFTIPEVQYANFTSVLSLPWNAGASWAWKARRKKRETAMMLVRELCPGKNILQISLAAESVPEAKWEEIFRLHSHAQGPKFF